MITIKLGFLLGLPLSPNQETSPNELRSSKTSTAKSKKSKKSSQISKKSKSSKSSKNKNKSRTQLTNESAKEKPPLPDYAFEVGKPKGFFHIEYKLFPHLETCHVDVLHWDTISKIFFQDNFVIYRNKIKDNIIWIPIMLEHKLTEKLSEDDLVNLKNVTIDFNISPNKKKTSANAKNEKAKMFYIKSDDVKNESFVEAYQNDPNVEPELNNGSVISTKTTQIKFKQPIISVIKQFDDSLLYPRFLKMLNKLEKGEQITTKQYVPPPPQPFTEDFDVEPDEDDVNNYTWPKAMKGKKNESGIKKNKLKDTKKSKKSDKSNKKGIKPEKLKKEAKIKVSEESYLTDAAICTYRLNENVENITDLFVVFSITNLSIPNMLCKLNPIVIKLKSIRNLPIGYLIENKFTSVYLQYNIPNIARHLTQPIILKDIADCKKIKINESHIFFYVPLPELSYLVECNRLFIELIGVYNEESYLEPSIYGSQKSDFVRIPVRPSEIIYPKSKTILLAVACYDLSLFAHSRMELELIEPFRHPTNCISQRDKAQFANAKLLRPLTIEHIHLNIHQDHQPSPLVDGILFECETALKIQVGIGCKLQRFRVMDESVTLYNRLLFIVYDAQLACLLGSIILQCNGQFRKNVLTQNYAMYTENVLGVQEIDPRGEIVTGFWIDNDTSNIIFLEGSRHNYCLEMVYQQVKNTNESLCRFYYNSETCFYKRIYENFLAFGGIYKITLKYALLEIFDVQWTHLQRCVPKPAFEAIQKLQVLLEMQSLRVISQHAIFPTANELISFDMEFGVPHIIDHI